MYSLETSRKNNDLHAKLVSHIICSADMFQKLSSVEEQRQWIIHCGAHKVCVSQIYIGITGSALSLFTSYLPNFKSLKGSLKALF